MVATYLKDETQRRGTQPRGRESFLLGDKLIGHEPFLLVLQLRGSQSEKTPDPITFADPHHVPNSVGWALLPVFILLSRRSRARVPKLRLFVSSFHFKSPVNRIATWLDRCGSTLSAI